MTTHLSKTVLLVVAGAFAAIVFVAPAAKADTSLNVTPSRGLEEALGSTDRANLYSNGNQGGFSLSGNFFSGRAMAGTDPGADSHPYGTGDTAFTNDAAALEGDQRVYALLIDGSYDFNYDLGTGLPLHPYLAGGMGMAVYGDAPASGGGFAMQSGDMVPLFRVGGGVTYRLGEQWDLSLDYKAGFTGGAGDQVFTLRNQQPVDMQVFDMGMHYQF